MSDRTDKVQRIIPSDEEMLGVTRIPYDRNTYLFQTDILVVRKRGGGERRILEGKWWINRNTPVGEDADLMERMPHNGYRYIDRDKIIAIERRVTKP